MSNREHLRRAVQVKKMAEKEAMAVEAASIAIDKKKKREQAKANKQTVECIMNATRAMLDALEEIEHANVKDITDLFDTMNMDCITA